MRWILVILFLYMIPLIILFKNNNNFKRSSIYGSMYIVAMSVIVISNLYISGIEKIRDSLTYNYYASDENKTASKQNEKESNNEQKKEIMDDSTESNLVEVNNEKSEELDKSTGVEVIDNNDIEDPNKTDSELVYKFKSKIYEIEREALVPMRECMPNSQNIAKDMANINETKKDVSFAREKCEEVINLYDELEIPTLSDSEQEELLLEAKLDVKQAYELREQAMASAEKLLETKNLKYVGEIKDYLAYSDEYIKGFIEKIKEVQSNIDK